jgi:uncharacterized metal-binding protein (TIGR02443 family)
MSQNILIKKRFIAGVRCSACHAQDKVRICITPDDEWIECIECGHIERRPTTVVSKGSFEDQPTTQTDVDQVSVVQFKPMR